MKSGLVQGVPRQPYCRFGVNQFCRFTSSGYVNLLSMNRIDQQITPISDEEVYRAGRILLLGPEAQNHDREEALQIINQRRVNPNPPKR